MTSAGICFAIALLAFVGIVAIEKLGKIRIARLTKNMPQVFQFTLPDFAGRILPAHQVHPGTFAVTADFRGITSWGEDAILTFCAECVFGESVLVLNAWKPDNKTPGIFEHAHQEIVLPNIWKRNYAPDEVKLSGKVIEISACVADTEKGMGWQALLSFAGLCTLVLGIFFLADHFFHFAR